MVKQASCVMGIFFLLSLVSPCWSQTGNPQGPATSDSDRMVYPRYDLYGMPADRMIYPQYNIFGMPSTTRQDRQMTPSRPVLPPGLQDRQGGSQPAINRRASRPLPPPPIRPASKVASRFSP